MENEYCEGEKRLCQKNISYQRANEGEYNQI